MQTDKSQSQRLAAEPQSGGQSQAIPEDYKPYNFKPPGDYPVVTVEPLPSNALTHGRNQFTLYTPQDQETLAEALQLRVHSRERLVGKKFVIPQINPYNFVLDVTQYKLLPKGVDIKDMEATQYPEPNQPRRRAVAVDCEMVGVPIDPNLGKKRTDPKSQYFSKVTDGQNTQKDEKFQEDEKDNGKDKKNRNKPPVNERSELAQICLVDILTGEILINRLVQPVGVKICNWRTPYNGITSSRLKKACDDGSVLYGWKAARDMVLGHVDSSTIIVGHSLENDLNMLRLAHVRCVDTGLLVSETVFGHWQKSLPRTWSLKNIVLALVGKHIQPNRSGHDCVEDTLATRELCLWVLRHKEALEKWAQTMRDEYEAEHLRRAIKYEAHRKEAQAKAAENGETQSPTRQRRNRRRRGRASPEINTSDPDLNDVWY